MSTSLASTHINQRKKSTSLALESIPNDENDKFVFKSLGCFNDKTREYDDCGIWPIGTIVELEYGKFPLNDYKDLYEHSNTLHTIDGKTIELVEFNNSCYIEYVEIYGFNKFGRSEIKVVLADDLNK